MSRAPGGIYIPKGGRISITNLSFQFGGQSSADVHVSMDVTEKWLQVSLKHAAQSVMAAEELMPYWQEGDEKRASPLLMDEFAHAMQAICTGAFALDSFHGAVRQRVPIDRATLEGWRKNRTSRAIVVSEVFRRGFRLGRPSVAELRKFSKQIFAYRDKAVHPSSDLAPPAWHPRLQVHMDSKIVAFRSENARLVASTVLSIIAQLVLRPRVDNAVLSEYCRTANKIVSPLVEEWEPRFGPFWERSKPDSSHQADATASLPGSASEASNVKD